ncbi:N-acetylmuramoyl-L-alanine amidase [Phyllobacterium sp. YR531]|uniref:N-acetylmuramoyl-L-alanine amidase n=1 Tax=Phyllobacterium sp. YR531 TaxID=1144343 RepID=UPI00026F9885|nr:N-acetylmuramoyl-L-alanine amidase [Phyllobacterium sp. YR531]EJN04081.1 negative regulator of beta-lactamase expression [Phyllobacterium sp. YR531]
MALSIKNHNLYSGASKVPFIKSPNVGGMLSPKFLIIHYTASGPDADIARFFAQESADVSAHLVVRRDGSIKQCVPFNRVAWHAGKSQWTGKDGAHYAGLNNSSIGIEIENWGPLKKVGTRWVSWRGVNVLRSKVVEARHKFGTPDCGWEAFTKAQFEATLAAARALCSAYKIEDIMGHDDIAPGRKSDPGPAWDMAAFKANVNIEAEKQTIVSKSAMRGSTSSP